MTIIVSQITEFGIIQGADSHRVVRRPTSSPSTEIQTITKVISLRWPKALVAVAGDVEIYPTVLAFDEATIFDWIVAQSDKWRKKSLSGFAIQLASNLNDRNNTVEY